MFLLFPISEAPRRATSALLVPLLAALTFASGVHAAPTVAGVLRAPQTQVKAMSSTPREGVEIQPSLLKRAADEPRDYVIELRERADLSAAAAMDWQARGRYVVEQLRATADRSQASLRRTLAANKIEFQPHWIKNVIVVSGGDADSVRLAAKQPGVARIRELPRTEIIRPEPGKRHVPKSDKAGLGVVDNIAAIGADEVWAQGTRGNGVTVGVIDTGATHTHDALRRQYRGWRGGDSYDHDYNWFDPLNLGDVPVSNDTHGSHVIGTIMGDDFAPDAAQRNRIGVAPGAQWIACLGLTTGENTSHLLRCGEFMLAPTRTDGSDPDPDLRPQVINNSWSENNCDGQATSFYADVVDAWVASGQFPVFAAGNTFACNLSEPPGLSTISSPASLPAAFAVGSTGNHDGVYAAHSLWGPTLAPHPESPALPDTRGYPQLKPQVVAPGVEVMSVYTETDSAYGTMTGTSMSAPHISGLVALMLEAGECLAGDYAALGTLVMSTARAMPYATGGLPAPGPGDVPNYATGWGEIDAAAAVDAAADACGAQGFIAGRVTAGGGAPIAGARIELYTDENVRVWEVSSEPDGSYVRRLPENLDAGYQLRVSAYGFLPQMRAGIEIAEDQTTPLDLELLDAPRVTIEGRVTDAGTGWPLHARLLIAGYPEGPVWTDAASGRYAVELPGSASYRIDIDSDIPGYQAATRTLAVSGATAYDITLQADTTTCAAPGHGYAQSLLQQDFEAGTLPAGWSRSSAGAGWIFGTHAELDQPDYWSIPARPGGFAATIDPAGSGGNDGRVDYLVSPPIDLAGASNPVLRFASRYWNGGFSYGGARVQVSSDDGASWEPLASLPQTESTWRDEAISLADHAGGPVRLRFHYNDGSSDTEDFVNPGWAIDDVAVVAGCSAPSSGGLVVGNVRDANTGEGLDGAIVTSGVTRVVTRTSEGPSAGQGFFALWADSGTATVDASRGVQPPGYGDAQQTVDVADGDTVAATLALPAGRLEFDPPTGPSATLTLGTTAEVPLRLSNTGSQVLAFGFEGVRTEEHFDGSFPPPGWSLADNGQGCPWGISIFANNAGGDGDAIGIYPYDCDGAGRLDNRIELPSIDLSASASASMGFFLSFHTGPGSDSRFDVEVSTDGGANWSSIYARTVHTGDRDPFNLVELDLVDFLGEDDVRIRLRYRNTPPWGQIQVDQIHVFRELGEDDPLAISPSSGVIGVGATVDAVATFDATGIAQPGTYEVQVRVSEDTPYPHDFGELSGTMTVTAPASWGSVTGTVRTLGRCESEPTSFADLPVRIVAADGSERITRTDANGRYRYWLDPALGPYDIEIEADAHVAAQRRVTLASGGETTASIDLRPLAACVVPDPIILEMSAESGGRATAEFDLLNLGALAGDYDARVGGDPAVPSAVRLSQNLSSEPGVNATFGCINPATTYSLENHWYRVFPLAERGLAGSSARIAGVRFGADSATSAAGWQMVQVTVHALDGPFVLSNLTPLASTGVRVEDTPLGMREVRFATPVEVSLDARIVVEISIPDGDATMSTFFPAGNDAGDTASAFFRADGCEAVEPVAYDEIGFEALSPILELDIEASDACGAAASPVDWLSVAPAAGSVEADGKAEVQTQADASALGVGQYGGSICVAVPGPDDGDTVVPVQLGVGVPPGEVIHVDGFE